MSDNRFCDNDDCHGECGGSGSSAVLGASFIIPDSTADLLLLVFLSYGIVLRGLLDANN